MVRPHTRAREVCVQGAALQAVGLPPPGSRAPRTTGLPASCGSRGRQLSTPCQPGVPGTACGCCSARGPSGNRAVFLLPCRSDTWHQACTSPGPTAPLGRGQARPSQGPRQSAASSVPGTGAIRNLSCPGLLRWRRWPVCVTCILFVKLPQKVYSQRKWTFVFCEWVCRPQTPQSLVVPSCERHCVGLHVGGGGAGRVSPSSLRARGSRARSLATWGGLRPEAHTPRSLGSRPVLVSGAWPRAGCHSCSPASPSFCRAVCGGGSPAL